MTRRETGIALVAAALAAAGTTSASAQSAPDPRHPVIAGFGTITPMPGTAGQPDPSLAYRVVFDVTEGAEKPDQSNPGLDKVARFVNLLGSAGIRTERGDLVAVVHGPATMSVLGDAAYRARYGHDNPNTPLIAALAEAGVDIRVCGQALARQGIERQSVSRQVTVDLSAMTTLATLQIKGWSLIR
ncbi:DsrE family protein [Sphingobium yanoikuyae]|uniref:DsrE family protein n=1 Tax=Sphingobium yanoikuyae TaxID=13690 RepID=A0AA42WV74_SPHYA|nr:DsrE family protein [Sphingobium yanoikuyae]MDH2132399.1 DsrE family protein [Sphingobium yanoikuyae]MDH2152094.1 DsrE family protein [Sphingobium yanoikuyae]MDH2167857.1 DsrE family protein [Sphingobium yanoikuyae]